MSFSSTPATLVNPTVWANASKVVAIVGTALISYLGMRLWVFVSKAPQKQTQLYSTMSARGNIVDEHRSLPTGQRRDISGEHEQHRANENEHESRCANGYSLSVVLAAYNEEQIIASTVSAVIAVLSSWQLDFEVLVVNDGSANRTGAIVAAQALAHPQLRLITHPTNQGYGAALTAVSVALSSCTK